MAEHEPPPRGEQQSQADRTLLGVAPPRIESSAESPTRSPVFVRSGTSVADVEPPPVPRMALPSRPPPRQGPETSSVSQAAPPLAPPGKGLAWVSALLQLPAQVAGRQLPLWQVLLPGLVVGAGLVVLLVSALGRAAASAPAPSAAPAPASSTPATVATLADAPVAPPLQPFDGDDLQKRDAKAPGTLSATEQVQLAEWQAERERETVAAVLRELAARPELAKDKILQAQLFEFVADADTARQTLLAIAHLPAPLNADLLYEVWTGTAARNDTTELARALVYSKDVKPQASQALAVALELRAAESCESFKVALPKALKDGDRRALHLLTKLTNKRGCGPKKTEDCFACLRDQGDELTATINAVKSRRPPSYPTP
ncbi:MAG TPA: hypothetical protein VHP33_16220 [Polyangiaceae bacterium]|nr:hypothetical protein [Polyangiaceae bacterium]